VRQGFIAEKPARNTHHVKVTIVMKLDFDDGETSRAVRVLRGRSAARLGRVPDRRRPDAVTRMVCGFCSVGCSLDVHLQRGVAVDVSPTEDYAVNLGTACPKGWESLATLRAFDRATTPLLRNPGGRLEPIDWPTAIQTFVGRIQRIQARSGAESVAFLGSGQLPSEELALLGALAKFGMGMVHGDGNTRQCMATSVVAHKQAFGFDAPPYSYSDLEASDVVVFVGANPCVAHPVLWGRVMRNPHRPAIVVIDPRRTETAMAATHHIALRPKSDLVLFYGLAQLLIERGWIDRAFIDAHTTGFAELAAYVSRFRLGDVADATEVPRAEIERLAELVHRGKRVSLWWTMGVNQSHEGVRVAQAIINLALLTGNIGRPGTGANSITGQCNAMGSRLFANTTNLLGGHDFTNEHHRAKVAGVLGIDAARIPARNSLAYDQILEGIAGGRIRGLWIVGTNSAHSWINQSDARALLGRLEFLVVQDMYATTDTARLADLVLPAAGWGEKDGTFINSERRIGLIKRVADAPGEALPDFHILRMIALAWGCGALFERWSSPEAVFRILAELTRGQPCDISGITGYADLERCGGIQWPLPAGASGVPHDERRLFTDGRFHHPDGKARLIVEDPRRVPEAPDERFPFTLLTGRGSASQWHTLTRTGKSAMLTKLGALEPHVEISPIDAVPRGIASGQRVVVESQRGRMTARAFVTHAVRPAQVFVPMHYARTNQLTFAAFDPYSRQPAYKACAVNVRPLDDGECTDREP
jgi:assimilatory nitrate reductase catalytic subunit